jgi:hypothetical protein
MLKVVIVNGKAWLVAATAEWPESEPADAKLVEESRMKRAMRHWYEAYAATASILGSQKLIQ